MTVYALVVVDPVILCICFFRIFFLCCFLFVFYFLEHLFPLRMYFLYRVCPWRLFLHIFRRLLSLLFVSLFFFLSVLSFILFLCFLCSVSTFFVCFLLVIFIHLRYLLIHFLFVFLCSSVFRTFSSPFPPSDMFSLYFFSCSFSSSSSSVSSVS